MRSYVKRVRPFGLGIALAAGFSACGASEGNSTFKKGPGSDGDGGLFSGDGSWSLPTDNPLNPNGPVTSSSACATNTKKAELSPLDMLLLVDTSYSMDWDSKWVSVKAAIGDFVDNPKFTGLGIGLQFFPLVRQCNVSDYATPAAPMATLPDAAAGIKQALAPKRMSGGTPMVPALEGAMQYTKTWAADKPDHRAVIILATDGIPDDNCLTPPPDAGLPNTLANVQAVAAAGATGTPKVATFVIGVVGNRSSDSDALQNIAQAGGTGSAVIVDPTQNVQAQFLSALNAIRRNALSCDYAIPPSQGGALDLNKVNVQYTPGPGVAPISFGYVGGQDRCNLAPDRGWYFDDVNDPHKVVLCDAACSAVKASDDGQIDVVFGCKRNDIIR